MKILFRGLGGAGQRHIRKFKTILGNNAKYFVKNGAWQAYLIKEDFSSSKDTNAIDFYKLENFDKTLMPQEDFYSIIATRTSDLVKEINEINDFSKKILVEKPGFNSKEELDYLKRFNEKVYIGLQRRFNPLTVIYEDLLKNSNEEINSISINVKSNCKLWHPYQSSKDFYALNNDMGGGVLKTECHELISTLIFFNKLELVNLKKDKKFYDSNVFTDILFEASLDNAKLNVNLSISNNETERFIVVKTHSFIYEIDYISNSIKIFDRHNNQCLRKLEYEEIDLFTLQALSFLAGDYKNSLLELFDSLNLFSKLLGDL